jgi:hypothetical protein
LAAENTHLSPDLKVELGMGFTSSKWHLATEMAPSIQTLARALEAFTSEEQFATHHYLPMSFSLGSK